MDINFKKIKNWLLAHRRQGLHLGLIVAFGILLFWLLGNVISPFLVPADTVHLGETGVVGTDHSNIISDIDNDFARFFYNMGDFNCHQRESRSFILNDNQMPFCSRCTAIFLGLAIGVGILIFLELELNLIWVILGLAPIGIDGVLQITTNYESSNPVRFTTGLLAGIVTGVALGFIIVEIGFIITYKRKGRELKKKESQ